MQKQEIELIRDNLHPYHSLWSQWQSFLFWSSVSLLDNHRVCQVSPLAPNALERKRERNNIHKQTKTDSRIKNVLYLEHDALKKSSKKYILFVDKKQNLPQEQRALLSTKVVGGIGWKNPAVLASLLWRGCLVCMPTSHSPQRKGRGRQSRQRITAGCLQHCWQVVLFTRSFANMLLTRRGLSALQLSEKRLFRVLQFEEARCGAGVPTSFWIASPASVRSCWRSCRSPSDETVQRSQK